MLYVGVDTIGAREAAIIMQRGNYSLAVSYNDPGWKQTKSDL